MDSDKDRELNRLSRRGFLKLGVLGVGALASGELLAACSKLGIQIGERPSLDFYDDERGSWLVDARNPVEWRRIVGEENPHAQEGQVLVFAGGVYIPSEIERFRSSPFITEENALSKNPERKGLLIINPVLVKGATFSPEYSENSLNVPSPDGSSLEDLKDFRHMWVAMSTNGLSRLGYIGYNFQTRAEVATGSAVTFANITANPLASLLLPVGAAEGLNSPYDGERGHWRYGRIIKEAPTEGSPIVFVGPNDTATRWDGAVVLAPAQGVGVARVGEIRPVANYNEAATIMAGVANALTT